MSTTPTSIELRLMALESRLGIPSPLTAATGNNQQLSEGSRTVFFFGFMLCTTLYFTFQAWRHGSEWKNIAQALLIWAGIVIFGGIATKLAVDSGVQF